MKPLHKNLVTVAWLKEHLEDPNLILLDATIPVVATDRDFQGEPVQIKGARFFDLKNTFIDTRSPLPNTMPSGEVFERECRKLGITSRSKIVIYDAKGVYSSPRAWFMFMAMGHKEVAVLNGGLPEWKKRQGKCETISEKTYSYGDLNVNFNSNAIKNAEDILKNINSKEALLIDARNEDRFLGKVAEPRAYLRKGHIPNSVNLPYTLFLKDGKFLSQQELKEKFKSLTAGNIPLIFSCGSGVTACIPLLAATLALNNRTYLYDGSWSEWGAEDNFPCTTS